MLHRAISCLFALSFVASVAVAAEPLGEFTGTHTRVVWVQDHGAANNDILAAGQRLKLMGIDSEDGRGERVILSELRNYAKPLLTPDGLRIVFSDQIAQKLYVVNWDGTGKKLLGDGLAVDVWRDPKDATDWVYFGRRVGKPDKVTYRNLKRLKLDEPKSIQSVWDQTDVGCDNFQLAADGKRAAGEFPWPNGGVVDLTRKKWQKLEQGCWASMAPDNSGVSWVFDGPHRNLQFHRPDQPTGWKVAVNSAPRIGWAEVFHPRWSNHVRYFVMTGPYNVKGKVNMISGGGPQVELYLGRFDSEFQTVEAWHQITDNSHADFYPDAWVDAGETSLIELPGLKNEPPAIKTAKWPIVTQGLLFAWNNSAETNQIPETGDHSARDCQMELSGRAFPGRFHNLQLRGGTATLLDVNEPILASIRRGGEFTIEFLATTQAKNPTSYMLRIGRDRAMNLDIKTREGSLLFVAPPSNVHLDPPVMAQDKTAHVAVTIGQKRTNLYIDGELRHSKANDGTLSMWKSANVTFGAGGWYGDIEAIAIYDRELSADEIARAATASRSRLSHRPPIATVHISATCRERSTIPDPQTLLPYRRALATHEFEVDKILSDSATTDLKPGARILVSQWVIFDSQLEPGANKPQVGDKVELTVEPIEDHPELQSERQILDVEALDLPAYYDAS